MKISPTDTISGAVFLQMLNDYKEYDSRQKEILAKYKKQIELLEWEVDNLKECLEEAETESREKLLTKLANQRAGLREYQRQIVKLKEENEKLLMELLALRQASTEHVAEPTKDSGL